MGKKRETDHLPRILTSLPLLPRDPLSPPPTSPADPGRIRRFLAPQPAASSSSSYSTAWNRRSTPPPLHTNPSPGTGLQREKPPSLASMAASVAQEPRQPRAEGVRCMPASRTRRLHLLRHRQLGAAIHPRDPAATGRPPSPRAAISQPVIHLVFSLGTLGRINLVNILLVMLDWIRSDLCRT